MFPPMSFKTKPDGVDTINVMQTLQNGSSADMSFMMNVKYWMQVDVHVLELCGADMQVSGPDSQYERDLGRKHPFNTQIREYIKKYYYIN